LLVEWDRSSVFGALDVFLFQGVPLFAEPRAKGLDLGNVQRRLFRAEPFSLVAPAYLL
jgi:hypothetical protein